MQGSQVLLQYNINFRLLTTCGHARRGQLQVAHGTIETPVFMPVATTGAIKGLLVRDLINLDAQIILANTYHMFLRPGLEILNKFEGLHRFMGWDRAILTDSGGFQIFSLSKLNKITEEGAYFQSHIDGQKFLLSPEYATNIQEAFGSDIHMVLDECTEHPATRERAQSSMERSMRWAQRCRKARTRLELAQFGIVQGGVYPELRIQSCHQLADIEFEGYAIGGLSVGESKTAMREMTDVCCQHLPVDKPRYLMGVGTPLDLIQSVALGVDMFDCVMPTRNARRGTVYTSKGKINIKNAQYKASDEPLDPACSCYTCQTYSRAFLRHTYLCNEYTSAILLTLHNISFYLNLMKEIRLAIEQGTFLQLLAHYNNIFEEP